MSFWGPVRIKKGGVVGNGQGNTVSDDIRVKGSFVRCGVVGINSSTVKSKSKGGRHLSVCRAKMGTPERNATAIRKAQKQRRNKIFDWKK